MASVKQAAQITIEFGPGLVSETGAFANQNALAACLKAFSELVSVAKVPEGATATATQGDCTVNLAGFCLRAKTPTSGTPSVFRMQWSGVVTLEQPDNEEGI